MGEMRKMFFGLSLACVLFSCVPLGGRPPIVVQEGFAPAKFVDLGIGKATITEVTNRFGRPTDVHRDNSGTTWLYYRNVGPVPGKVEMQADTKSEILQLVSVFPDNLFLEGARKLFGQNFKVIRYNFDSCLNVGGEAPLYESKDGQIEFIVYERLGIALSRDGEQIKEIDYLSKPIGTKESRCKVNR